MEVANPEQYRYIPRIAYTTSTGSLQQWMNAELKWTREESLSEITSVEFVDLPEERVGQNAIWRQTFVSRLTRQLVNAKVYPDPFVLKHSLNNFTSRTFHNMRHTS